jgi:hypothetical protein
MSEIRQLTNMELADLPDRGDPWINRTWDARSYTGCVLRAWAVDHETWENHRREGGLCMHADKAGMWVIA